MGKFESFDNSKNKLQRIWEKNEANTSKIDNNLKKFEVDFKTVNFTKKITTIPIFEEKLVLEGDFDEIVVVDLINIPEWILNHINIIPIVSLVGDTNTDIIITIPGTEVKEGDIQFFTNGKHWIAKLENNNYQLKIFLDIRVNKITEVPDIGSPKTQDLDFNLDLNLKIINPRIYENVKIQKK